MNMKQRCRDNDYRARRIYMITLVKVPEIPVFSYISESSHPILTEIGKIIEKRITHFHEINSKLEVMSYVIMPDHIHFIVFVKDTIEKPLGNYIGILRSLIIKDIREAFNDLKQIGSCFESGFHDRLLLKAGQLKIMKRYIADNPRRYLIKRNNPDFFNRILGIRIGEKLFDCYGNPFLLRKDLKERVWVRSAWDEKELESHRQKWLRIVLNGGVLVSPFISRREKGIMEECIEKGGSIILIRKEGFPQRFKPSGKLFELCAQGRLLMIAESGLKDYDRNLSRAEAMKMNAIAGLIAAIDDEPMAIRFP